MLVGHNRPGNTEVEKLDAECGDKHIRGFEIAVDELPTVQRLERAQRAQHHRRRFHDVDRPFLEACGKRLTVEQFHHDEQGSVGLADLVELAHVGVTDGCRRSRQKRSRDVAS